VAATLVGLAACSSGGDDSSSAADSNDSAAPVTDSSAGDGAAGEGAISDAPGDLSGLDGKKIGVLTLAPVEGVTRNSEPFMACLDEANAEGLQVDIAGDFGLGASTIDQWVANDAVDLIYLVGVTASAVTESVAAAEEAGIPVVLGYAGVDPNATTAVQGFQVEAMAPVAQYLADRLGGEGKIALINNNTNSSLRDHEAALRAVLQGYPDIEIVAEHQVDFANPVADARDAAAAFILANPDLDAIWAGFDSPAIGAANAVEEAGRWSGGDADDDIFVTGGNGDLEAIALLEGNSPLQATFVGPHYRVAQVACEQAAKILDGQGPDASLIWLRGGFASAQNISSLDRTADGYVRVSDEAPYVLYGG